MKTKKIEFDEVVEFCERPMALGSGAVSYLFMMLNKNLTIDEVREEVLEFVKEEQESYSRGVLSQQNKDYNRQEDRISDDPEIK